MANLPLQDIINNSDSSKVKDAYANLNNLQSFDELLTNDSIDDATTLAKNQIMHMVESWRYLSSSINAFLKNSDGNAIHLAYYAELRAAMSLYAGSGILINNSRNAYIDFSGNFQYFRKATIPGSTPINAATHKITWGLWEHWTTTSSAIDILNKGIILFKTSPENLNLDIIGQKIGLMATKNLIQSWGVDLLQLSDDHNARNEHSYQTYWTNKPLTKRNQNDINYIKSLWKLLLPQSYNQQGMHFDVALVKYVLDEIEQDRINNIESDASVTTSIYDEISNHLNQQLGISQETFKNILEQEEYDIDLFQLANNPNIEVKNVLSRAVFLSRIAKLSVELNIKSHSNGRSWILFWLEHCGIWDPDKIDNARDLCYDYEDALSDFNPRNPEFDIWNTVNNNCPAAMLSNPEACLSWNFS